MTAFKVPSAFQLFGQRITVKRVANLVSSHSAVGEARLASNEIFLQENVDGLRVPETQIAQTFFHELLHFCFGFIGQTELEKDEVLVDNLAQLLHQAMTSMEYETKEGKKK